VIYYAFILCCFSIGIPVNAADNKDTTEVTVRFTHPVPDHIKAFLGGIASVDDHDELKPVFQSYLTQFGYFNPEFRLSERNDTLYVTPGDRAIIRDIGLAPDRFPQRSLILGRANEFIGEPFSQPEIELWIAGILEMYERDGRPFTEIKLDSLHYVSGNGQPAVDLFFSFGETDEITLHSITIEGNRETREGIIYRQSGIFPGDRFSRERIDNIRPRLMRTGLFRSVAEPEIRIDREGGILLLRVEEARFNSFDGIVGYVPTTDGDGYFTGLAHVTMRNLFGTMRRVEFRWQRESRYTQELFFSYREPYVAGLPAGVAGSFSQRQQDTTYVQSRTRVLADTDIFRQFTVGVSFEYESVIPSADLPVQRVRRSTSNVFGIDLQYDSRDELYAPQSGIFYRTEYQTGILRRQGEEGNDSETVRRFTIDAELYISPVRRQVVKIGVHGRETQLDNFQVSDLFRFGGTRSLRGYGEGQFMGSRLAWSNLEYRFMTAQRSYLFGFFDTGYYYVPSIDEQQRDRESFEYSYGVGLQVETGIGLISIGFGFGRGDTFSTGKIHIGVVNEF
jgi:outer membrane protein insertion porin family